MFDAAEPKNELREGGSGDYPGLQKMLVNPILTGSTPWRVVVRDLPADWAGLKIDTINSGAARARIHWSRA